MLHHLEPPSTLLGCGGNYLVGLSPPRLPRAAKVHTLRKSLLRHGTISEQRGLPLIGLPVTPLGANSRREFTLTLKSGSSLRIVSLPGRITQPVLTDSTLLERNPGLL